MEARAQLRELKDISPGLYGYFLANVGFLVFPFWLGAVIGEWDLGNGQAGAVLAAQLASAGTVSLFYSSIAAIASHRTLIVWSLGLQIIGNLLSCILIVGGTGDELVPLGGCRVLAGLGDGLALATMTAMFASSKNPQKYFSWGFLTLALFSAAMFGVLPSLMDIAEHHGYSSASPFFGALLFFATTGLFVFFCFSVTDVIDSSRVRGERGKIQRVSSIIPMLSVLILYMGVGNIYAYVERIAVGGGLASEQVSHIKAMGSLLVIAGPLLAAFLGGRTGNFKPIVAGLLVLSCSNIAISSGASYTDSDGFFWVYSISLVLHDLSGLFVMVYIMSFIASIDSTGKMAGKIPAFQILGTAVGPLVGGIISDAAGFSALGWTSVFLYAVALALLKKLAAYH